MKLSTIKTILSDLAEIRFELENGTPVPVHFHVTEVGSVTRHFIDCGGTVRTEQAVNFQLWSSTDTDHRLASSKLLRIIELSEAKLHLPDAEIEVEYQGETIGKYGLDFNGVSFVLVSKNTACLAADACGIPAEKTKRSLSELTVVSDTGSGCCTPGGGCC